MFNQIVFNRKAFNKKIIITAFVVLFSNSVSAEGVLDLLNEEPKLLAADQAFKLQAEIFDKEIIVQFNIAQDYYLYKKSLFFYLNNESMELTRISEGKIIHDEYFGEIEVFYNYLDITIPLNEKNKNLNFTIEYQGCASSGFCFPPQKKTFNFNS